MAHRRVRIERGVTLVVRDLKTVNGLALAIMVLSKAAGIDMVNATPGLDGVIVDRDGSLWVSPGFSAPRDPS